MESRSGVEEGSVGIGVRRDGVAVDVEDTEKTPLVGSGGGSSSGAGSSRSVGSNVGGRGGSSGMHSRRRSRRRGSSIVQTAAPTSREIMGFVLVGCSALSFSVMALLVRMGAVLKEVRFPSFQLVLSRSVFQFLAATTVLLYIGENPLGPRRMRFWLLMRGLVGGLGIVCLFFALTRLSLGECTVLVFTMPIITLVFSRVFLGEQLDVIDEIFALLCLCGIVLVAKPHLIFAPGMSVEVKSRLLGACGAIAAALAQASIYIIIRKMGASVHYMMNVQYLGLVCALIAPIGAATFHERPWRVPKTPEEFVVFLGVGFFGLLAQIFMSRGLQLCRAGPGAMLTNLQILFSFVLGVVFLDEIPSVTAVLGALIVLTSTLGVTLHKFLRVR